MRSRKGSKKITTKALSVHFSFFWGGGGKVVGGGGPIFEDGHLLTFLTTGRALIQDGH